MPADDRSGELTRSLVLWCPDWPMRAARIAAGAAGASAQPLALIEKGLVFACDTAAREAGVRRGLRVREAQARCPELLVLPYDTIVDARLFEPLLAAIDQTSPGVQPIRPGLCALRVRGPARYFGGEPHAAAVLLGVLAEHGVDDARAGIADGPFAAELAARQGEPAASGIPSGTTPTRTTIVPAGGSPGFLAGQPVEVMADAGFIALCRRLGMRRLGDLVGLGDAELVERFGVTGARVHALVTGRDVQTVVPRAPQRILERSVAFDDGLDRVDQIAFAVRQTAEQVVAALTEARLVATAVTVVVETERDAPLARTWLHPRWFTAGDLVDRVRWQLQGAGSGEGVLGSPVVRVTITPESVDAAHHHEEGLWGDAPDERVHHALSRVQSMLGHDAVVTATVGGGRMPSQRQVLVPWGDRPAGDLVGAGGRSSEKPWPGALPDPQPATVFLPRVPVSLLTRSGEPIGVDERGFVVGEPALFAYAPGGRIFGSAAEALRHARPVTGWAGPWPVDERWWDAASARRLQRFAIVDADGIAWLLVLAADGWQAEARYD